MEEINVRDTIVLKDRNKLILYKNNNKKHPKEQIDLLEKNIKEFGFTTPLLIDDRNNEIIAGHARLQAARNLGMDRIPCIMVDDLTEAQVKALRISDNRTSELAKTDWDNLKIEFEALQDMDFDMELTGFSEEDINKVFKDTAVKEVELQDVDSAEEVKSLYRHQVRCPQCGHLFKKESSKNV